MNGHVHNDNGRQYQRGNKLYTCCTCGEVMAIDDVTIYPDNGGVSSGTSRNCLVIVVAFIGSGIAVVVGIVELIGRII